MNENERDFKKVDPSNLLSSEIIELNLLLREQIKHLLEEKVKRILLIEHKINLDDKACNILIIICNFCYLLTRCRDLKEDR